MKKILIVINSLDIGGSEKSLISFLNLIDYNQCQVDLLMLKKGGEFEGYIPEQVNVLDVPAYYQFLQGNKDFPVYRKYVYNIIRLKSSIDLRVNKILNYRMNNQQIFYKNQKYFLEDISNKYDIAIAYAQGFPTYLVADKVTARKKIAWINCDYRYTSYDKKMDEKFYNLIDEIVAVSDAGKQSIISTNPKYKDKIEIIKDVLNPSLISKMADEYEVDFSSSFINIVTVARLSMEHKGYDIAIEAAKNLRDRGIQFKWYVIGEGHDREKIEELIEKYSLQSQFILLGSKKNPYPYMKACDIYVQTSKFEGLGLTLIEAKILKSLIVTTNFSTASEIIENDNTGLIVGLCGESVADGILKYIDDIKLKDRIKKNLLESKVEDFNDEIKKIRQIFL